MDDGDFQGVIDQLLSEGYAIWLMDWRAHGTSKKNRKFQLNTIEHMAKFDLTSVVDFITEKSDQKLVVGAIGYGAKMTLLSLPYLRSIQQLIFLDAVSISPTRKLWIPGYRIIKFLSLMGKEWVNGPGTELESAALFRSGLKFGGVFSFFVRQNIAEVLAMVDANATKISWICSSRRSVKIGKRLAKKQARIHKVSVDGVISEFKKLISSQPI
jgi:pimeloyl-ACP methyl ester carboxylesterase